VRLWIAVGALLAVLSGTAGAQTPDDERARIPRECAGSDAEDCIVRKFKDTPEAATIRGRLVFGNYCVLCHGAEGRGDGRAARIHTPRPANLRISRIPSDYMLQIVRKGGEQMGRGKGMPPWGDQLTDEQIRDVIHFLFTIRD
jgi:mono/diheme cytochrome c family protein